MSGSTHRPAPPAAAPGEGAVLQPRHALRRHPGGERRRAAVQQHRHGLLGRLGRLAERRARAARLPPGRGAGGRATGAWRPPSPSTRPTDIAVIRTEGGADALPLGADAAAADRGARVPPGLSARPARRGHQPPARPPDAADTQWTRRRGAPGVGAGVGGGRPHRWARPAFGPLRRAGAGLRRADHRPDHRRGAPARSDLHRPRPRRLRAH